MVSDLLVGGLEHSSRGCADLLHGAPPLLEWDAFHVAEGEPGMLAREVLCPLAHECLAQIQACGVKSWELTTAATCWSSGDQVEAVMEAFARGDSLCCALLCSSLLERTLSNLFVCLSGVDAPPLFKDVLENPIMLKVGKPVVAFLRSLIGSPSGANLRNILWHGFVFRVAPEWLALLVVTTLSVSTLVTRFPSYSCLREQPLKCANILVGMPPPLAKYDVSSFCLPENVELVLKDAFARYRENRMIEALALLFVGAEHAFRVLFCRVNKCPDLQLTADSLTMYTTMETFINETTPSGSTNVLVDYLGRGAIAALKDMFFLSAGPRIRDRLSHGQVSTVCRSIVDLAFAVISGSLGGDVECHRFVEMYESRVHPKIIARRDVLHSANALLTLHSMISEYRSNNATQDTGRLELYRCRLRQHVAFDAVSTKLDGKGVETLREGHWRCTGCESLLPLFKKIGAVAVELRFATNAMMVEISRANDAGPVLSSFRVFDSVDLFLVVCNAMTHLLANCFVVLEEGNGAVPKEQFDKALLSMLSFVQGVGKAVKSHTLPRQCLKFPNVLAKVKNFIN